VTTAALSERRLTAPLLLAGFALALGLRVAVGGVAVADSAAAGLTFAGCLLVLSLAAGVRLRLSVRAAVVGVLVAHRSGTRTHRPGAAFVPWALVVTVVAGAEEVFLRGALFDALLRWRGTAAAIVVGAVLFALLHVPLYGWQVVPLDLAVGVWLGALRRYAGSPTAPLVAHVAADLASWWLR
jgi:membrane protease YdiL (CAAX protease family)